MDGRLGTRAVTPAAPAPTAGHAQRVGRGWVAALTLGVVAVFASWFGPLQILLPVLSERIAGPGDREAVLALVVGTGAAVSMVANPLWGLISDRCRVRTGSRLPVVYAGTLIGATGQVVLFLADSTPAAVVGWILVQLGLNGPFAVLAALIADRVPEQQRGLVGSLFGVGQIVGVIGGTVVAEAVGGGPVGFLVLALVTPALLLGIVVAQRSARDVVARPAPTASGAGASGAGTSGAGASGAGDLRDFRPTHDFVWAWLLRFLMNLTNAILLIYLFYFLDSVVQVRDAAGSVLVVTVVTLVLSALCAALAGTISDRLGRRRVFAVAGAAATALGLVLLATATTMPLVLAAAAVLGLGWGLFVAVDMAIITGTLTEDSTSGTLLGVANVANALPQVVAPAVAAPIVTTAAGYPALYGVGAGIAVAAALCTLPLRSVR